MIGLSVTWLPHLNTVVREDVENVGCVHRWDRFFHVRLHIDTLKINKMYTMKSFALFGSRTWSSDYIHKVKWAAHVSLGLQLKGGKALCVHIISYYYSGILLYYRVVDTFRSLKLGFLVSGCFVVFAGEINVYIIDPVCLPFVI